MSNFWFYALIVCVPLLFIYAVILFMWLANLPQPVIHVARKFVMWNPEVTAMIDGKYVPARSLSFHYGLRYSIPIRLKLAWLVFVGRCDVLDWEH